MSRASDRLQAKVTKLYVDMRLKRISKLDWMIQTEETVGNLRELGEANLLSQLFYAQLLITKEAYAAADETLREVEKWLKVHAGENPACHAYYLYLTTLMREDTEYDVRVTAKLYELAGKYPNLWQIQWLIYYIDRALLDNPSNQYHFLKKMFLSGCRSPLLYSEARLLLDRNPAFLYEFSEFELQLMAFMVRHTKISRRVCDVFVELMAKRTDYRYLYWLILCECYEVNPSESLLKNIARMMILGGCKGEKFSLWYRKAITEGIEMTGLFQAFMKSLPIETWQLDGEELSEQRKIPQEVLEYFSRSSDLDEERMAYLYALVHKYKENWFQIYRTYEPLIQPFMLDQLYKGQMNAGLSYLYEHLLKASTLPVEHIETFLDICHSAKITNLPICEGTLVVSYHHLTEELYMPFANGEAILPLFGEVVAFCVQNHAGNIIPVLEPHITPMINKEIWTEFFKGQEISNILYHMSVVENALAEGNPKAYISHAKKVIYDEHISQAFKEEVAAKILSYWDVNGEYEEIVNAAPYVFYEFGTYSKAKEVEFWKQQYLQNYIGIYGMQFLVDHYSGSLQEACSIYRKARSMGVNTGNYAESILLGMMQENKIVTKHQEVLEDYVAQVDKNLDILQNYLEFVSKEYYMSDQYLDVKYMQIQAYFAKQGMDFNLMAKLAFLQGLVNMGVGNISQDLSVVAVSYIEQLLKDDIYFSWMQPLEAICSSLVFKAPYQVLEYKGTIDGPIWVRFTRYGLGSQEPENLQSEVMEPVLEGLFVKRFLLCYGERMHYEIYTLSGTEQKLLKQGVLQKGQDFIEESNTRFAKLNHLLKLREENKDKELYQMLEAYCAEGAMAEQLFTLK